MSTLDWDDVSDVKINSIEDIIAFSNQWYIYKGMLRRINPTLKLFKRKHPPLTKKQRCYYKGRLAEILTESNLRIMFHRAGYRRGKKDVPMSYFLTPQYGSVDVYVRFTNINRESQHVLFEVKNFKKYSYYSEGRFIVKVLDRFTKTDPEHKYIWVLCVNRRNIPVMQGYCKKNNILILPFNEDYTPEFILKKISEDAILDELEFYSGESKKPPTGETQEIFIEENSIIIGG